jgi:hypothetical protein
MLNQSLMDRANCADMQPYRYPSDGAVLIQESGRSGDIRFRKPQRITITVSWRLYQQSCSDQEGRSLSNLACHWLELQSNTQRR